MNKVSLIKRAPVCFDTLQAARDWPLSRMAARRNADAILMCEPTYFDVLDVKNLFMKGNLQAVDKTLACKQWNELKDTFQRLGRPVHVIPAQENLEDMVFAANQLTIDEAPDGSRKIVLSRMTHASRQREVAFYAQWFRSRAYEAIELVDGNQQSPYFEGHGDAIWHPGKRLLWGGYGHRSERRAYDLLSVVLDTPIICLRLVDPVFYHLDTAFCAIDEETALIYPPAFEPEATKLVKRFFKNVIEASAGETANFACNGVAVGKHLVLQKGSSEVCKSLRALGIEPVEVDVCEFMKSGGGAFCLKTEFFS